MRCECHWSRAAVEPSASDCPSPQRAYLLLAATASRAPPRPALARCCFTRKRPPSQDEATWKLDPNNGPLRQEWCKIRQTETQPATSERGEDDKTESHRELHTMAPGTASTAGRGNARKSLHARRTLLGHTWPIGASDCYHTNPLDVDTSSKSS